MRAELYEIALDRPGRLSIMARPRGGEWLSDEIQAWRDADLDVIVSLLTNEEQEELDLRDEASLCEQQGITFISYPIQDRDVPQRMHEAKSVIHSLARHVTAGKHIAVHCRMGIGRSALIAAATLVALGETTEQAFAAIRETRGYEVPDTSEQREWVERFSADIATKSPM